MCWDVAIVVRLRFVVDGNRRDSQELINLSGACKRQANGFLMIIL